MYVSNNLHFSAVSVYENASKCTCGRTTVYLKIHMNTNKITLQRDIDLCVKLSFFRETIVKMFNSFFVDETLK